MQWQNYNVDLDLHINSPPLRPWQLELFVQRIWKIFSNAQIEMQISTTSLAIFAIIEVMYFPEDVEGGISIAFNSPPPKAAISVHISSFFLEDS